MNYKNDDVVIITMIVMLIVIQLVMILIKVIFNPFSWGVTFFPVWITIAAFLLILMMVRTLNKYDR